MQVLVNTDNHIDGREELARQVEGTVQDALARFGQQLTRVEVHLHDRNGPKQGGDDRHCLMEARLSGLKPIAVTHNADTLGEAIDGAVDRLVNALDHTLGRLRNQKGRTPMAGENMF